MMSIVRCDRCDKMIDLDLSEAFTNDDIPGLDVPDYEWVCFECLTDKEATELEHQ